MTTPQLNPCFMPIVLAELLLTLQGIPGVDTILNGHLNFKGLSSGSGLRNHGCHHELSFQSPRSSSDCPVIFRYVPLHCQ